MACPIAWPDSPVYPVDASPSSSSAPAPVTLASLTTASPASTSFNVSSFIDATLWDNVLQDTRARIVDFINRVGRLQDVATLQDALSPIQALEEKFRSIQRVLSSLKDPNSAAEVLEALADGTIISNDECLAVQQAHSKWLAAQTSQKVKQSVRDWISSLELLAHEMQAVVLLQLVRLSGQQAPLTDSLEFITDRLAIRQAMLGLALDLNHDSTEGTTMDEVQLFWTAVEQAYDFKPSFWATHHSKLFPDSLFDDSPPGTPPSSTADLDDVQFEDESSRPQLMQQHKKRVDLHPTPDLARLAAKAADLRQQQAATAVPASPTLAKLLGGDASTAAARDSTGAARKATSTFKRSNSMPMAVASTRAQSLSREVSMRQRTDSVEPPPMQAGQEKKARISKRKQLSPKKHATQRRDMLIHSRTPAKLKIRSRAQLQTTQSFADLGRLFRPGLAADLSSDIDFPSMPEFASVAPTAVARPELAVVANTPQSKRTTSRVLRLQLSEDDDAEQEEDVMMGETPQR